MALRRGDKVRGRELGMSFTMANDVRVLDPDVGKSKRLPLGVRLKPELWYRGRVCLKGSKVRRLWEIRSVSIRSRGFFTVS